MTAIEHGEADDPLSHYEYNQVPVDKLEEVLDAYLGQQATHPREYCILEFVIPENEQLRIQLFGRLAELANRVDDLKIDIPMAQIRLEKDLWRDEGWPADGEGPGDPGFRKPIWETITICVALAASGTVTLYTDQDWDALKTLSEAAQKEVDRMDLDKRVRRPADSVRPPPPERVPIAKRPGSWPDKPWGPSNWNSRPAEVVHERGPRVGGGERTLVSRTLSVLESIARQVRAALRDEEHSPDALVALANHIQCATGTDAITTKDALRHWREDFSDGGYNIALLTWGLLRADRILGTAESPGNKLLEALIQHNFRIDDENIELWNRVIRFLIMTAKLLDEKVRQDPSAKSSLA